MIKKLTLSILLLIISVIAFTQQERKYVREGNKLYTDEKYDKAEISYRKALEKNVESKEAEYNLAGSYYKQQKFEEAINVYKTLIPAQTDKAELARIYHNMGNCYLQSNKLKEAIESYKNALRNNPADNESRYNLAYALDKNKKQMQDQQKDKNDQKQEASEYAKKIKKEAEALVARHKYKEAYDLMKNAEKADRTILVFKDFTDRIHDVSKINF